MEIYCVMLQQCPTERRVASILLMFPLFQIKRLSCLLYDVSAMRDDNTRSNGSLKLHRYKYCAGEFITTIACTSTFCNCLMP